MKRVCFLLKVRKDRLDEYRVRHATVWPEMQQALRESGWTNYSLFLRPDGLLVGYVETEDFEASRAAMKQRPINDVWQTSMAGFFEDDATAPDDAMRPLEEVFHLA